MPDHEIHVSDEELALLERVRQQQGLATIEQAAEWLVKSRIREHARRMNGRGRALYIVDKEPKK